MPKYLAVFYETKRYKSEIEAETEAEAREIALWDSEDDMTEDSEYYSFELHDIRHVE